MAMTPRIVEIRANILKKNDLLARERDRFRAAGVGLARDCRSKRSTSSSSKTSATSCVPPATISARP
jgi:hypothetical protein